MPNHAMPRLSLLVVLAIFAHPLLAQRTTAAELDQILSNTSQRSDRELAAQLSQLQLTERLPPTVRARYDALLPGPLSRQQLLLLADLAAFLDPPPAEIPTLPAPDRAVQRQMLARTVNYVKNTVHQLPNFFATRTTLSFENNTDKKWTFTTHSSEKLLYRNGEERIDSAQRPPPSHQGLITSGEFGSILATVLLDAADSNLSWLRWEQPQTELPRPKQNPTDAADPGHAKPQAEPPRPAPLAVFHFSTPAAKSHYQLTFCCIEHYDEVPTAIQFFSAYEGEITIDLTTGAILRLLLRADLKPNDRFTEANLLVKYGPVEIAGKTYICPIHSAAYSVLGFPQHGMRLNDVVFDRYHVSRSETRILTGSNDDAKHK